MEPGSYIAIWDYDLELTKLILEHIRPPFKIVKLEGDAIAYYVPVEMLPEAERVPL